MLKILLFLEQKEIPWYSSCWGGGDNINHSIIKNYLHLLMNLLSCLNPPYYNNLNIYLIYHVLGISH
jgi:hypothetical protein